MNRLKILHITAWYPTDHRPANGIFVREHIRAAALNHDCTVWAFYDHPDFATPKFEVLESNEYGLKTFRTFLPFGGLPKVRYLVRLRRLLKFGAGIIKSERPDVIHAHTFHAAVPAVILGRRFGIPAVMTEHWSGFQQGLLNRADKLKLLYALRRVKVVMPVSSFLAEIMKGYGVAADFEVVPNVVDGEVFYPPPEPVARGD